MGATPCISLSTQPFWHVRRAFRGDLPRALLGDSLFRCFALIVAAMLWHSSSFLQSELQWDWVSKWIPAKFKEVYSPNVGLATAVVTAVLLYLHPFLSTHGRVWLSPNVWIVRPFYPGGREKRVGLYADVGVFASKLLNPDLWVYKDGAAVRANVFILKRPLTLRVCRDCADAGTLGRECSHCPHCIANYRLPRQFLLVGEKMNEELRVGFFIRGGGNIRDVIFTGSVPYDDVDACEIEFQPIKTYSSLLSATLWWALVSMHIYVGIIHLKLT